MKVKHFQIECDMCGEESHISVYHRKDKVTPEYCPMCGSEQWSIFIDGEEDSDDL